MIIQIRGTSGSGKSTVMRKIMDVLGRGSGWNPVHQPKRKQPLYYKLDDWSVLVLGHYESPCGGGDTIGSARAIYGLIQELLARYPKSIILCEGLLLSEDVKWSSQLKELRVLYLTTPLERCLKQIQGRRKAAGNDKPLNVTNTTNRVQVIERSRLKLLELGILCTRCAPSQACKTVLNWIQTGQSYA